MAASNLIHLITYLTFPFYQCQMKTLILFLQVLILSFSIFLKMLYNNWPILGL